MATEICLKSHSRADSTHLASKTLPFCYSSSAMNGQFTGIYKPLFHPILIWLCKSVLYKANNFYQTWIYIRLFKYKTYLHDTFRIFMISQLDRERLYTTTHRPSVDKVDICLWLSTMPGIARILRHEGEFIWALNSFWLSRWSLDSWIC